MSNQKPSESPALTIMRRYLGGEINLIGLSGWARDRTVGTVTAASPDELLLARFANALETGFGYWCGQAIRAQIDGAAAGTSPAEGKPAA